MALGYIGNGVKVGVGGATSPQTYHKIEQIQSIVIPTFIADKLETTVSSTGGVKSYTAGMRDVTDTTVRCVSEYSRTLAPYQGTLRDLSITKVSNYFLIEIPTGRDLSTCLWLGIEGIFYVGKWAPTADVKAIQMSDFTLVYNDVVAPSIYEPRTSVLG